MRFLLFGFQRFVPSEFGNEVDRVSGLPPFEALLDNKRKVRRAIEAAGIPFTYVSANSFAAYFVDYLLHPHQKTDEVTVYGSGEAKGTCPKMILIFYISRKYAQIFFPTSTQEVSVI